MVTQLMLALLIVLEMEDKNEVALHFSRVFLPFRDAAAWLLHFKTMKPPVYALAARHSSEVQRRVGRDNNSSMVVRKAGKVEVLIQFPFWLRFPHFYSPFRY